MFIDDKTIKNFKMFLRTQNEKLIPVLYLNYLSEANLLKSSKILKNYDSCEEAGIILTNGIERLELCTFNYKFF